MLFKIDHVMFSRCFNQVHTKGVHYDIIYIHSPWMSIHPKLGKHQSPAQ
uniref:Uncharacterized protein n=1 Tax=Arundo donax TaxID=35708 RepID=A0A0A9GT68_ARUDO